MIWARPLSRHPDDDLMLARAGLGPAERASVVLGERRVALVSGLDFAALTALRAVAGAAVTGANDAGPDATGLTALLRYTLELADEWSRRLDGELGRALRCLLRPAWPAPLKVGPRTFEFGTRTFVMGVVNVTPDSFSDGGRFFDADAAVKHALALVEAGADLLDVGGESTRPGADEVPEEEEARRVLPVLERLARELPTVPLSIDTSKAAVARRAVAAGASLVNDVTHLRDEAMVRVVAETGVAACVMHLRGTPRTMQKDPRYDDVVADVLDVLEDALRRAEAKGVPRQRVFVDPGIGFGKTVAHNLLLLRRLGDLRLLGAPVLVGTSRKSFLGQLTGGKPANERVVASAASAAVMSVLGGADVVRVHDVAETRDALAVADAIRAAR